MVVSFVYAVNCRSGRQLLWEDLCALSRDSAVCARPWVVMGDFNQTLNPAEHSSGGTRIKKGMEEFHDCLSYANLQDLTIRGNQFTWWNNQELNPIAKNLDRVLINDEWMIKQEAAWSSTLYDFPFPLHDDEFLPRLLNYWHTADSYGTAQFNLVTRLKELKGIIRDLNKEKFLGLENHTRDAQESLHQCQDLLLSDPSRSAVAQEKQAHKQWMTLTIAEEKIMVTRRAQNQIHYLINEQGQRLTSLEEVKSHCVSYYQDLIGSQPILLTNTEIERIRELIPFRLGEDSQEALVAEITDAEIKKEFFSMPTNKTPGPDGYTGEFFRASWDIISEMILLLQSRNSFGLVISKIIAQRMEDILPLMISNSQSAFVKGRLLVENVLLASEMVQDFGRKNVTPRALLKVDLRKAFECVKQCVTTTSSSMNINGELCGYFKGGRGLRQGDPLSPTLFVIAMEALSNLLSLRFDSGRIGYHPLGRNPIISHLAFADDLMIFFDGRNSSLQEISSLLDDFKDLSGLSMNSDKSTLFAAGISEQALEQLSHQGFSIGTFPVRYLALPLLHRNPRKADYSPLLDNIKTRFSSWSTKVFSFAGHLQLISFVIYSSVNFWSFAFASPKGASASLNPCAMPSSGQGVWKSVQIQRFHGKISVFPKKKNGGSLWVAWMREHMLKNQSYWSAEVSFGSLWMWKFLVALKPLVKPLIECTIGDGKTASYWYDNWSQLGPLIDVIGHDGLIDVIGHDGPRLMGIPRDATVVQGTGPQGWRLPSHRTRNPLLQSLRISLLQLNPPVESAGSDSYSWGQEGERKDFFSTKITWNLLRPASGIK
ncbi:PREDICTED: uncharacterized protein LOC104763036 [Camelina sativa]|uniref:Uncharacterized protein LOC104763036 n=1 Tax=Camelina sativa TaxID=90675 RepID=A0ABM0XEJ8_CAMSA|nr:PREDICTED: uncharacterized protein LOC104763036 [Camelina sativa]